MAIIIPNESFKASLLKTYINGSVALYDLSLVLYESDTVPTRQDLLSYVENYYNGTPYIDLNFSNNLEAAGHKRLVLANYAGFKEQNHVAPSKMEMQLSSRSETFSPETAGNANWFLLTYGNKSALATSSVSYWSAFGTVGEIDSGADLELSSTQIDSDKKIKFNNITLDFDIQGITNNG